MSSNVILYLSGLGVAFTLVSVIKAAIILFRKRSEEKYLLQKLQKKIDIATKLKKYEGTLIDNATKNLEAENINKEKLHEILIKEIEYEINEYISKNKNKLRETKAVVSSSSPPQKQRYLEKLLQKLLETDMTPKLKA